MSAVADDSVALVVTSPPYPMIEMWDEQFRSLCATAGGAGPAGEEAAPLMPADFERFHTVLDDVWAECRRALIPGGIVCVNIGDAVRTVDGGFCLYANHARVLTAFEKLGFVALPPIIWHKPSNSPTKFMGSGMLPGGAYVTLDHEYILILRLGNKREFDGQQRELRRQSAYFWEERNTWFSDLWDLRGARQALGSPMSGADAQGPAAHTTGPTAPATEPAVQACGSTETRSRSGAFPFELAYRLVNMYSLQADTVLDPFSGTGTTAAAAVTSARGFAGYEIDRGLASGFDRIRRLAGTVDDPSSKRLSAHLAFVERREASGRPLAHTNRHYGFAVMTRQEKDLVLPHCTSLERIAAAPDPDAGNRGKGAGAEAVAYRAEYVAAELTTLL